MSLKASVDAHVVIDGLPAADPSKKDTLYKVLDKKLSALLGFEYRLQLLMDGKAIFGAFLDCLTVANADKAVAKLNQYPFTKQNTFIVNRWSDFLETADVDEEYMGPEEDDEEEGMQDVSNTNTMMQDKLGRPQLLVKTGDAYEVQWSYLYPASGKLEPVRNSRDLQDWSVMDRRAKKLQPGYPVPMPAWSPQGTYVITHAPNTVRLWGGRVTSMVGEFSAPEMRYFHMSGCEKYLVLYGREFSFFEVGTGKHIMSMPGQAPFWPVFKYNADDTLVATFVREKGTVLIFEAATMKLIVQEVPPRHTIKEEGMCAFAWSPTDPSVFAYSVAGDDNLGFRVQLDKIQLLGRDEEEPEDDATNPPMCKITQLCRRNYFQTKSLDLLWHPMGTFLAAKITKNNDQMAFGIFKVMPKSVSAEALDVKGDPIRFAWQPNAGRFAIITAESKHSKQRVSFYESGRGFKEVGSFASGGVRLFWASQGTRCASVNYTTSRLEFYGVQGCGPWASEKPMALIASVEHPMITDVEWDPTGRFACSYTSSLKQQMDNSFMVWNVNGQKVFEQKTTKLSHCTWRPCAPSLLSEDDLATIKKTFAARAKKFKDETLAQQKQADEKTAARKRKAMDAYCKVMDEIDAHSAKEGYAERRAELIESSPAMKNQMEVLSQEAPIREEKEVEEGF